MKHQSQDAFQMARDRITGKAKQHEVYKQLRRTRKDTLRWPPPNSP